MEKMNALSGRETLYGYVYWNQKTYQVISEINCDKEVLNMPIKMALVGNPNSGKTTLFNNLTGSTSHVGNWPGVTVDIKEGRYRRRGIGEDIVIVDLPGIYSLSPYSPEEVVSRNYIHSGEPAVVINIVDATNLERNLYLTTQILEMETPMLVALNMMDLIEKMQDELDVASLERELGVPVVPIVASRGIDIETLMTAAIGLAGQPREGISVLADSVLGDSIVEIAGIFRRNGVDHPVYHAVKSLEGDNDAVEDIIPLLNNESVFTKVRNIGERARGAVRDIEAVVADNRYRYITAHYSPLLRRSALHERPAVSDRIDSVLTNRIWGIPIFILIMFVIFHLTFSENLVGFTNLPAPGTWLAGRVESLVEMFTGEIDSLLSAVNASPWLCSLVVDGILGGVGAVIGFLPLILVLYLCISILEDTGYMARAAFIMDRLMRRFGISGRSFVPLIMGFGCSVPAVAATKTLANERDRRITIMLIPFMSCGAKIPVYGLIVPVFFPQHADLVITGFYFFGIAVAILCGIVLKNTVFQGNVSPFILELPPYRIPSLKSLVVLVWDKLKGFAVRVGVVITLSTIVIWFLSNFGFNGGFGMVESNSANSILGYIGNALRFFFIPLGFASGYEGWKAVVAVLSGLVAREAVVSTMGQLYADNGAATALTAAVAATFSVPAALSLLTWNLFSTPCMAAVGAIRDELGGGKWFWGTMLFHIGVAWTLSALVFFFASTTMRVIGI